APPEAPVVAVLPRGNPADVLVAREEACDPARPLGLARGSRVGTSAPRRQAQLQDADPGLVAVDVRGNVGTRLQLVGRGAIEALAVAACALDRLETALPPNLRRIELGLERFPTCPGQGAIAVQAAAGSDAAALLQTLDDPQTRAAVEAERSLLRAFGGGCGLPLGAHAWKGEGPEGWRLHATWLSPEGVMARAAVRAGSPTELATTAFALLQRGAGPPRAPGLPPGAPLVAITLDAERVRDYAGPLARQGWRAEPWPLTVHAPTQAPLPRRWDKAGWVAVASPRAAPFARQAVAQMPRPVRIAAVGSATALALRREGLPVHAVSRNATGEGLASAIASFPTAPGPVLVPQAQEPLGDLEAGLHRRGWTVLRWPVYATRAAAPPPPLPAGAAAAVLASPSAAQALGAAAFRAPPGLRLVAIGPSTARAMREAGLPVHATAPSPTPAGLCEALA
ncbi:MAG TPA: uroporphyrinogen-III synthase, partial [Candidatus Thermoplasmatota archaeon]|nr:uroporphyrinogen-III synthase [Candidatus Thermoplasmatota archaeon]